MCSVKFISQTERRLLIFLVIAVCITFYSHLAITKIEEHNKAVTLEQTEKLYEATTLPGERMSFSYCSFGEPIINRIFWLQFFINPLLLLLLWNPTPIKSILTIFIHSILTFSLFNWILRNYISYVSNEVSYLHSEQFGYFSEISHTSSVFLALLCFVFIILQCWLLSRFAFERFHAKISLR